MWTTTPWTLPANVALAVRPDLDYAQVQEGDETYYLSAKTIPPVIRNAHPVIRTLKGSELVGLRYRGPFDELEEQASVEHRVVPWDDAPFFFRHHW